MIPGFLKQILERIYAHAFHITSQAFTSFGTLSLSLCHQRFTALSQTAPGIKPHRRLAALLQLPGNRVRDELVHHAFFHIRRTLLEISHHTRVQYIYIYIYNAYSHVSYDSTGPLSLAALLQIQGNHVPDELVHHAFSHISLGLITNVLTTNPGQSRPGRVGSPCLLSHLTRTNHKRPH